MNQELFEGARGSPRSTRPWLVSSAAHGVLVFALIFRPWANESVPPTQAALEGPSPNIVWLSQAGPGGGGGGGGSRSQEPSRHAQLPGRDRVTVPAADHRAPHVEEIKPAPVQHLEIPAQTLAASDVADSGVLEAEPPGMSGGGGSGSGAGSGTGSGIGSGARIQGAVLVECVVETTGVCLRPRLVRSLDATSVSMSRRCGGGFWDCEIGRLGDRISRPHRPIPPQPLTTNH